MSSTNVTQPQDNLAAIFTDVSETLEHLIAEYQVLASQENDAMRERIEDFCEDLEDLRSSIGDENQSLDVRIANVGNISDYIEDLMQDIATGKDEKTEMLTEKMQAVIRSVEEKIEGKKQRVQPRQLTPFELAQRKNENYFQTKKSELDKIVAAHPELKE